MDFLAGMFTVLFFSGAGYYVYLQYKKAKGRKAVSGGGGSPSPDLKKK
jgi:hypothetical protein